MYYAHVISHVNGRKKNPCISTILNFMLPFVRLESRPVALNKLLVTVMLARTSYFYGVLIYHLITCYMNNVNDSWNIYIYKSCIRANLCAPRLISGINLTIQWSNFMKNRTMIWTFINFWKNQNKIFKIYRKWYLSYAHITADGYCWYRHCCVARNHGRRLTHCFSFFGLHPFFVDQTP